MCMYNMNKANHELLYKLPQERKKEKGTKTSNSLLVVTEHFSKREKEPSEKNRWRAKINERRGSGWY